MVSSKKIFLIVFLFFVSTVFYLILSNHVFAVEIFFDDFGSNREIWNEVMENWDIVPETPSNNVYRTQFSNTETRAMTVPADTNSFTWTDYVVEARFMSLNGVDQYLMFRVSPDFSNHYMIDLRASGWIDSDNIRIIKRVNNTRVWWHELNPSQIGCSILHNSWYEMKVNVENDLIKMYFKCPNDIDFREIFSVTDIEDPLLQGSIGLSAWSGSWSGGVEKWFDNVKVSSLLSEVTDTPLIIIPGLGASWNTKAMVYGETVDSDEWKMTPFVNVYKSLVETAESNGYTLGDDLFVWNYDWRKSINDIKSDLDNFINLNPKLNSVEKIDFVGHSLGGLVSRTWSEGQGSKVGKLITVGSPHLGAVQAYGAVAGGVVSDKIDPGQLALKLFLQIHKDGFQTDAQTIREFAPVVKDLVPTFDFLEKYGKTIPASGISYANNFLSQLNQNPNILSFSHFVLGNTGETTPGKMVLTQRSFIDKILDLWPEGHPLKVLNDFGDGTVLQKSAYLIGGYDPNLEFNLNHRQIVSDSQAIIEIMNLLGKENVNVISSEPFSPDNLLIFYLASPATLEVNGVLPEDGNLQFVVFPNPVDGDYQAKVTGSENGKYHLFVGQITPQKEFWNVYQDKTSLGETDLYGFKIDADDPLPDPLIDDTGVIHFRIAADEVSDLLLADSGNRYLKEALRHIVSRNPKQAIRFLAYYRKFLNEERIKEYNKAGNVMNNLALAWQKILAAKNMGLRGKAYQEYLRAKRYYSLASGMFNALERTNFNISLLKALSFKSAGEILENVKSEFSKGNYNFVEPFSHLTYWFSWESI